MSGKQIQSIPSTEEKIRQQIRA